MQGKRTPSRRWFARPGSWSSETRELAALTATRREQAQNALLRARAGRALARARLTPLSGRGVGRQVLPTLGRALTAHVAAQ